MNTCDSPSPETDDVGRQRDAGFTLIEILIAIVLVGILSAVAVVGISNLVSKGTTSACQASSDAARAASAVYFASNSAYPTLLSQLTTNGQLVLPTSVTVNPSAVTSTASFPAAPIGLQASGAGWYLTMTAGSAGAAPTFVCN